MENTTLGFATFLVFAICGNAYSQPTDLVDASETGRRDLISVETCLEMCTKQTNRCEMRDTLRTVDKATQCKVVKDRCDAACSEIVKAEKRSQPAES